jgi:REP element-mobilizing transposase RayT
VATGSDAKATFAVITLRVREPGMTAERPHEPLLPFHLFDREADVAIVERKLPHWSQPGTVAFITWRTLDSMPATVIKKWFADRDRWLRAHAIDPAQPNWREKLYELDRRLVSAFLEAFWNRWQDTLDDCHGARVLGTPELAEIVAKSLRHFDNDRYLMLDFVVMPNHIHLLAAFRDEDALLNQCESWKRYSATHINRRLKQHGRFWQDDFDHLVRSEDQFAYLRRYIADNPRKARLRDHEFKHYSRPL